MEEPKEKTELNTTLDNENPNAKKVEKRESKCFCLDPQVRVRTLSQLQSGPTQTGWFWYDIETTTSVIRRALWKVPK